MNPKVSIIIPVYNTEQHLHQCLNSAVGQTLKEIEIIIVNDASTDDSLKFIKEFQAIDYRIKLIDFKKNKGNGYGRNTAIKKAKGSYILFLDSDDWLENNTVEKTYLKATEKQSEIVLFGYRKWHDKKSNYIREVIPSYKENSSDYFKYFIENRKGFHSTPWGYLFSKKLIIENPISFSEGIYFEDINFVCQSLYYAKKINVVYKTPLYNYRAFRKNAITYSFTKKKINDLYTAHIYIKQFLKEKNIFKTYEKEYMIRYLVYCISFSFMGYLNMKRKEKDKELKDFMRRIRKSNLLSKNNMKHILKTCEEMDYNKKDGNYKEKEQYEQFRSSVSFLWLLKHCYIPFKIYFKVVNIILTHCAFRTNLL